ncbi:MAG: GDSL-type esterase/lipase family protein [Prevotella sp.]|jgi:lysophospholipase L1-like esterase|nr:GDSL-type esterase/lipase family protein [Prevotella sp.]MCI1780286.1 GDSL-type esterase/lipase family protein [Prevotella sp.]MCI1802111.1 GDSL-type esterase/lipase family protein [Prevotella sp.]MCI1817230.1 GDSL-type esterase/lipase family protein [Prevotella sp.]MCI1847788.1 GDSL-type esterase/lipase family protein [Prevotella sp.]
MKRYLLLLMFLGCLSINLQAQPKQPVKLLTTDHWVGTWATAQQIPVKKFMPYNNNLTNRSVRQVVKVSIGGNVIRLKISNELSSQPLEIRSIYIAYTTDDFAIYTKSAKYFKFNKNYTVTVPARQAVWSDGLPFDLRPLSRLTITINYTKAPKRPTVHMGSRTTSYIMQGVTDTHSDFASSFREDHWFNIAGIDVWDDSARCIAIIGNSITDGKCSTNNAQNRWPDIMAETLQDKYKVKDLGVLNLGIGNNRVALPGGFGYMAKERFDHDILGQNGVKSVIIFEGVNDIAASKGNGETVVRKLIEAYGEMIKKAKDRHLEVYLGTITPFLGSGVYSVPHEAAREKVNDWIRLQKDKVNGILDFDKLLSNPLDPHRMKENVQGGDWLHPNPEGYLEMGEYAAGVISGERLKGNP